MANNYIQSSFIIGPLTEEQFEWWFTLTNYSVEDELDEINKHLETHTLVTEYNDDWGFWVERDGEGLHIMHDQWFDAEQCASVLQAYLTKFDPERAIGFEVAYTCDKLRPNEFGGSAWLVSADQIHFFSTQEWIRENISKVWA